jgi:hypothetical protein
MSKKVQIFSGLRSFQMGKRKFSRLRAGPQCFCDRLKKQVKISVNFTEQKIRRKSTRYTEKAD